MSFWNARTGKGTPKHRRRRLSLLPSMQADWYVVLALALALVAYAASAAQVKFEAVSAAVDSAQSHREGKATLVVPEATEIVRAVAGRLPPTSAAAATSSEAGR